MINIKDLKNKIIYRATYRATKEMDKLLTSLTKKYINKLNENDLILLSNLLDSDDEDLYKLNHNIQTDKFCEHNKIIELFKNYEYRSD